VQLAGPLSFGGGCLILVSLCAFPAAQRAWGTLAVTRRGLLLSVAVALLIPCTRFAVASSTSAQQPATIGALAWLLLYVAMLLKAVAGCFAFTGTMIIVNLSTPPALLGEVNGVGQALASLARGVGPAMGGVAWSMVVHAHVAGAQLLPFACVAGVSLAALALYAFVQPPPETEEVVVCSSPAPARGSSCCQQV
jgi:hypothetical protein